MLKFIIHPPSVVPESNTLTWKVKKETAKSSEDSEMQVKAVLVGFCA